MKYLILLLMGLAFASGVLGFTLLAGTAAFIFRIAFVLLLVATTAAFFIPKKESQPLHSTFARSFKQPT